MASIWQFRDHIHQSGTPFPQEILDATEGSPLLAQLLANRGLRTPDDIRAFLNLQDYQPTSGWALPDMEPAVNRILKAIEAQEPILIYGDFDVDGITGTSVLYETLKKHLKANVSFYIPDRATEGHGLNTAALVRLTSSRKLKLVITTDTGITNFPEVSLLNGLGVDTIVTDHHALPENLPPALANINSQRLLTEVDANHPMGHLCGAGVAYKLCEILLEKSMPADEAQRAAESLLDIVAVGTVVDMVPLVHENRWLVYRGLQVLNRRQRPGFNEILEQAGAKADAPITSETLGFTIGPRLNALGRLERADQGVELITSQDPERIRVIAAHLEFLNRKRRDLCDQTYLEAEAHLQKSGGLDDKRAIILASPDWNPGIIGIVASRLIEKYHVPVFMMVVDESKAEVRCSARSIPGFHLHDELLALERYFLGFGGHAGAGGFALKLDRLEAFKRDLHQICQAKITEEQMRPSVEVDAKLVWSQVNPHLLTLIDKLAPFGMANPSPKFVLENVNVAAQRFMGEDERHIKLVLANPNGQKGESNTPLEAIIWNFGRKERFDARAPYSFVVVPGLNSFNGTTKVQLIIEDYKTDQAARLSTETQNAPAIEPAQTAVQPAKVAALKPEVTTIVKTVPSQAESESQPSGPQWIDHRGRESIDVFIGQLMLPLQDQRSVLIYHEGKKPDIPFLNESLLKTRTQLTPAQELILWDLPPSAESFQALLKRVRPEVIHLVGGKYQSVPIFASEQNYLKLIVQILRRGEESQVLEVPAFASQLATTEAVVTHGLMLLEKLNLLESCVAETGNLQKLQVRLLPQNASSQEDITRRLEYAVFQQALKEVGKFRAWVLKTPIATIKSTLNASILSDFVLNSSTALMASAINYEPGSQPEVSAPV
ncbi:single-stranded-DNA-specific exonuclease RecJ [Vampirovibrio chlorellavorus]|uniref:single-stranded-DNA-specific exonuclease RecJ n=1 Tax=Vampirovibrio chlorellavorus TaxID=758823 RepID=UPI0026F0C6CB|nr:single-stranded-DNA-specific exonuclease RecJ [Vampirovibrio chlorellavorus]